MNDANVRLLLAGVCFLIATVCLYLLILQHPSHDQLRVLTEQKTIVRQLPTESVDKTTVGERNKTGEEEPQSIIWAIVWKVEEFGSAASELQTCRREHLTYITILFCVLYLYKQAFAIPGSFFLNVAGGALFGIAPAFALCTLLTTVGCALCYLLSAVFGRAFILQRFGQRIEKFQQRMNANAHQLFLFLIFARLFPISPSWLVNIAAPVLQVPFDVFLLTAAIGLSPYIFIGVHAGSILSELHDWRDIFTVAILTQLTVVSIVPLVLAYYVSRPATLAKLGISAGSPVKKDKIEENSLLEDDELADPPV